MRSRLRRSLTASTAEGMVADVVGACSGGAALTGWALHLGAGPQVVSLLGALPSVAQMVQLPSAWCTSTFGHRRAALWAVGGARLALLPLVFLPAAPLGQDDKQAVLFAVASVTAVLGVAGNNAWTA